MLRSGVLQQHVTIAAALQELAAAEQGIMAGLCLTNEPLQAVHVLNGLRSESSGGGWTSTLVRAANEEEGSERDWMREPLSRVYRYFHSLKGLIQVFTKKGNAKNKPHVAAFLFNSTTNGQISKQSSVWLFWCYIYLSSACMSHLELEVLQNLPEQEWITTLCSI